MNEQVNCWEYMQCGKGSCGTSVEEPRICPASTEEGLDKVHGGRNAGRACWVVAGTLGGGTAECPRIRECGDCMACDFYRRVRVEEGKYFWPSKLLLRVLGRPLSSP